ncbi:HAD-IIIC family phosphatase [Agrobacterium vitis]|uniref:HAD-IIIC family phosphatase n=1 Tax=Agrobacterium vitis TaxID=373 RepID=UPI0008729CCA|nr:HAD-IIIC family phosphatase [Agrobacterium vitis]MCE6078512.1 HAD-IIIC family phosphatase [Agrobacterium vitis]MUO73497.1 HAD-IIIC family phosphatase [Agrobacterium vitis]MUO87664.1 HAD-IIIC family phosphatase [Agrobacterium vitis]
MNERVSIQSATLVDAITSIVSPPQVLEVHSSIPALLGTKLAADKWVFLRAVRELARKGYTLLFPSFTFSYTATGVFNSRETKSETGILADWVLDLPESHRTPNPIFSFVVIGQAAKEFMEVDHRDAYGEKSIFSKFESSGGGILMLGAKWDFCSFLHRMEDEHQVPYREYKTFNAPMVVNGEQVDPQLSVFVRRRDIRSELNFAIAGEEAEREGLVKECRLGQSVAKYVKTSDLATLCRRRMSEDPFFLLKDGHLTARDVNNAKLKASQPPVRVALLGSENLDMLASELKERLDRDLPSRSATLFTNDYGQMFRDISTSGSTLAEYGPDVTIFAETLESIVGAAAIDFVSETERALKLQRWCDSVLEWLAKSSGRVVLVKPVKSRQPLTGDWENSNLIRSEFPSTILDGFLSEFIRQGGIVIDPTTIITEQGSAIDLRTWYLARAPFSPTFSRALAQRFCGVITDYAGLTTRLIVLDLDNTLWGGVAGEDGLEGIRLGGDFPGNVFRDFQHHLKAYSKRGVALAIASKNDEKTAFDIIDHHPEMVLRKTDFVDWEINWNSKAESIQKMAARLQLTLSNVLFVDDNPVEREHVKRLLPDVVVPGLGAPETFVSLLCGLPQLNFSTFTKSDENRLESFQSLKAVADFKNSSSDRSAFVESLKVKIDLNPLSSHDIGRAEQLMLKTNQYNTSMRRYSMKDLEEISKYNEVYVVEVQDKFNKPEIMGVIVIKEDRLIDSFVLSCRALGKGVEESVLNLFAKRAFNSGRPLRIDYIQTPKNGPVVDTFRRLNFREEDGIWESSESTADVTELPVTIAINEAR